MINFNGAFQLLSVKDGIRSHAVRDKAESFAAKLMEQCPDAEQDNYVVLVLMDDITGEYDFSTMPYLTVRNYIKVCTEYKQNG